MHQNIYAFAKDGKRQVWEIPRLWKLAENLPQFEWEIQNFAEFDEDVWFCEVTTPTVRNVFSHCMRINSADLSYPIMLDHQGGIIDGVHRILKAKTIDLKTVPAVQFLSLPEPDRVEDWPQ